MGTWQRLVGMAGVAAHKSGGGPVCMAGGGASGTGHSAVHGGYGAGCGGQLKKCYMAPALPLALFVEALGGGGHFSCGLCAVS